MSHFSFEKTERKLLLTDIQGCLYELYDPELASTDIYGGTELIFGIGNLSKVAIKIFGITHKCNKFCKEMDLPELSFEVFDNYPTDLPGNTS